MEIKSTQYKQRHKPTRHENTSGRRIDYLTIRLSSTPTLGFFVKNYPCAIQEAGRVVRDGNQAFAQSIDVACQRGVRRHVALLTTPFSFAGKRHSLNFSTSAAGTIRIALQTPSGQPISGFSLIDCDEVFGDSLDRIVSWKSQSDVGSLSNTPIRMRIELRDADLFSFKFSP